MNSQVPNAPRNISGLSSPDCMTEAHFERVAHRVYEAVGIVLKDHKRQMVISRLSRRVAALGLDDFGEYLDFLESSEGRKEHPEFINAVTTNLTSFFREDHHFEHLEKVILGPMKESGADRIRLWSAGCSTGEEAYSIAVTVRASFDGAPMRDFKILATDVDTSVLSKAKSGVYPDEKMQKIPEKMRGFVDHAKSRGSFHFKPEIRQMVSFKRLNLLGDWPLSGPFDGIFCRNVLIYFDSGTKAKIIDRLANQVRPGGALYLGHSESLLSEHPLLSSEGRTIYRRLG